MKEEKAVKEDKKGTMKEEKAATEDKKWDYPVSVDG